MQRLRDETAEHHRNAERRPLEVGLAAGTLPQPLYVGMLGQRYVLHRVLDSVTLAACANDPRFATLLPEELLQTPRLAADLAFFGVDADTVDPLPATAALCDSIDDAAQTNAAALLGFYYVLEGSKNGAAFLAPRVRRAYGLEDACGTQYLDPHGPRQRELWARFKTAMDEVSFTPEERDALVAAAQRMFDGIAAIDDELCATPAM